MSTKAKKVKKSEIKKPAKKAPHDYASLGQLVQERRLALGLDRPTVGQRIGCSGSYVGNIERDQGAPVRVSERLAQRLMVVLHLQKTNFKALLGPHNERASAWAREYMKKKRSETQSRVTREIPATAVKKAASARIPGTVAPSRRQITREHVQELIAYLKNFA